ncbi:TPA: hypothetical protein HA278_01740 [Candidatus Woesearchaeota archaeon]|jgi:hypothetical protein|nr:hypothetical protein [Candidatus Woesearchaeota archaeon]
MENKFQTKFGTCIIHKDRIELDEQTSLARFPRFINKTKTRIVLFSVVRLVVLASLSLFLLFISYISFSYAPAIFILTVITGVFFGFMFFFVLYYLIKNYNFSIAKTIHRKDITNIRFYKAVPYVTRAYFSVYFRTKKGTIRKRNILLPGAMENGPRKTEEALDVMKRTGLYKKKK